MRRLVRACAAHGVGIPALLPAYGSARAERGALVSESAIITRASEIDSRLTLEADNAGRRPEYKVKIAPP